MEQIYPISVESCTPYVGRHVCAVMHDGSYYIGRLSGVRADGIQLESGSGPDGTISVANVKQAKSQIQKSSKDVQTKAFFNPFFFPFASLAFLFALPFFFI